MYSNHKNFTKQLHIKAIHTCWKKWDRSEYILITCKWPSSNEREHKWTTSNCKRYMFFGGSNTNAVYYVHWQRCFILLNHKCSQEKREEKEKSCSPITTRLKTIIRVDELGSTGAHGTIVWTLGLLLMLNMFLLSCFDGWVRS